MKKINFLNSKSNDFYMILLTEICTRRIQKMPGKMTSDDQLVFSPIDNFKIKTCNAVTDIVQVTERFNIPHLYLKIYHYSEKKKRF
jgi:hypothetical protein